MPNHLYIFVKMDTNCYKNCIVVLQNRIVLGCLKQCEVSLIYSYNDIYLPKAKNCYSRQILVSFLHHPNGNSLTKCFYFYQLFHIGSICSGCISLFNGAFIPNLNPIRGGASFNSQHCNFF